ncbi:hypothetical protein [Bradyrhizobium paxllaeri]|uniref:hypothetical protein n=1 Tax=Bradyrhizobium paxllaeri TaxID=190148 RepID=UPI00114676F9|nr:hypothetical protein [Bradyrhizobium paxllaeri]
MNPGMEIRFDTTQTHKKMPAALEGNGGHSYPLRRNPEQSGDVIVASTTNAEWLVLGGTPLFDPTHLSAAWTAQQPVALALASIENSHRHGEPATIRTVISRRDCLPGHFGRVELFTHVTPPVVGWAIPLTQKVDIWFRPSQKNWIAVRHTITLARTF